MYILTTSIFTLSIPTIALNVYKSYIQTQALLLVLCGLYFCGNFCGTAYVMFEWYTLFSCIDIQLQCIDIQLQCVFSCIDIQLQF